MNNFIFILHVVEHVQIEIRKQKQRRLMWSAGVIFHSTNSTDKTLTQAAADLWDLETHKENLVNMPLA